MQWSYADLVGPPSPYADGKAARFEGPEWSEETSKEWGVILEAADG